MKNKILAFVILFTVFTTAIIVKAESENQRAKTAEKYFVAKQYEKAAPLYAQLVSSNPKNYKFNYYYGICLLITGKDKSQALPYLETALQSAKSPEDIYYYMGRALHLNYRFEEALRAFTEFNGIIGVKNANRWSTPQLMEMCNNAKKILDSSKNDQILERIECLANEFYSKYQFTAGNGKLLSMPDEIIKQSKSDNDDHPMIFLSANGRVMYYSSVNPESSSRDLYRVEKDLDNNWTAPVCLDKMVNTSQDELFPSCNPDGRILYFSSRGHNSTGGFDIFKTYYNTVSKTWSKPANMGSPYNSPDDDYCFVASVEDQVAYYTSQRESGPGRLTVYKMHYSNTEELPIAINGKFKCIGQPDLKEATITITRDGDQNIVANLVTDSINGGYTVELPGPGVYKFTIEAKGFQSHSEEINFQEFADNIMIQDIFLSRNVKGAEDLAISNRKLSESNTLDGSLTATMDENGNITAGITTKDLKGNKIPDGKGNMNGGSAKSADGKELAMASGGTSANGGADSGNDVKNDKISGTIDNSGVIYRVQIGAFFKHTKEVVQKRLEKKTDKTMMSSYSGGKYLRFFMGSEANYSSAKNLRFTLSEAGFHDAFIVAFENGEPINLQAALGKTGRK